MKSFEKLRFLFGQLSDPLRIDRITHSTPFVHPYALSGLVTEKNRKQHKSSNFQILSYRFSVKRRATKTMIGWSDRMVG